MTTNRMLPKSLCVAWGLALCLSQVIAPAYAHQKQARWLELPLPAGTLHKARYHGSVRFDVPRRWQAVREAHEIYSIRLQVSRTCRLSGTIYAGANSSSVPARVLLRRELPSHAEPGQPTPLPAKVLGDGKTRATSGRWEMVAPPAAAHGFTAYGGALLQVAPGRVSSLLVGYEALGECTPEDRLQPTVIAGIQNLLQSATLEHASFG